MAWDEVEVSNTRACLGRIFFHVPAGIIVRPALAQREIPRRALVRVPFRILTKDEEKFLNKNYKSIKKQVEDAFKKK